MHSIDLLNRAGNSALAQIDGNQLVGVSVKVSVGGLLGQSRNGCAVVGEHTVNAGRDSSQLGGRCKDFVIHHDWGSGKVDSDRVREVIGGNLCSCIGSGHVVGESESD